MLQMSIAYDGASKSYNSALDLINLIFTFVFIIEACLKIIGNGIIHYFTSN